ncbi:X8 domain-containing protein [Heracleum sosnowskyi]|uniref:X8 domain-containing protein n=1 Tax=Heracleum sosnowskyi TaxID=360622 RepID=A0AAD8JCB2_9APIA|nr:X8 domain-containing protein [Heracleum sosnowskyi]
MTKPKSFLCSIAIFLSVIVVATSKQKDGVIPPPTWCVASAAATDAQLQGFVDFACGGKIDCRFIQPGADCYQPNTPRGHGSYCLDAYYRIYKDCNQIGTIVYKDPSYGDCLYI